MDRLFSWVRRSKWSFFVCYSALFAVMIFLYLLPLFIAGKEPMAESDGLNQGYTSFVYFGWWVRRAIKLSLEGGALVLPQWDLSFGLGGDEFADKTAWFWNPFNYLSVLVPSRYSEWAYDASVILRIYCSGLVFALFSRDKVDGRFPLLAGSLSYVFSGWVIKALKQYAFVNPMILFPLLLLGAERVFKRKSPVLFIVSTAFFFLVSFLFAYMAFIFLVIYCLYLYFQLERRRTPGTFFKWVGAFVGLTAIGVAIAAIVLAPHFLTLLGQSRLSLEREVPVLFSFRYYADVIIKLLGYGPLQAGSVISGGCLFVVSCVLVFANKEIAGKKTMGARIALVVMLVCLLVPELGSILNGFQYVTSRWVWVFSLCAAYVVALAMPRMLRIRRADLKPLVVAVLAIGVYVAVWLYVSRNPIALLFYSTVVALLVILALWSRSRDGKVGKRAMWGREASLLAVAVVSLGIPFYCYLIVNGAVENMVDAGSAWTRHTSDSIASLVKRVDDDGLWRYDYDDVPRIRNNSAVNHLNSFDYYTSYYDNNVNRFFSDLEISDTQLVHQIKGLTRRSYLEAALGAKYFVIGAKWEYDDEGGKTRVPKLEELPYGAGGEPVASKVFRGRQGYVYENFEALPLAYTFSHALDLDSYDSLSAAQKQQALLQAVAEKDPDADMVVNEDQLVFDDVQVGYSILGADGVEITENGFKAKKHDASVTLGLEGCAPGELYVEFLGLDLKTSKPALPKDVSVKSLDNYIKQLYFLNSETEYWVSVTSDSGRSASMDCRMKDDFMYGGDDDNIINLGCFDEATEQLTISFSKAGTYSYDEMNVIVQPMDNLDKFVSERRTYPVELTQGVDSFTAKVSNDERQILFLSIPWSKGWSATVDGEAAEIKLADRAFMAIDLPEGDHVVELRYETPGLKLGLAVSALGLIAAVVVGLVWRRQKRPLS